MDKQNVPQAPSPFRFPYQRIPSPARSAVSSVSQYAPNPRTQDLGHDDIISIPYHLFMTHPHAIAMQDEIVGLKERVRSLENSNTQLASSVAQLSSAPNQTPGPATARPALAASTRGSVSVTKFVEDDSGRIVIDGQDFSCRPAIPLEDLPNPHLMCWNQQDAQQLHANSKYGKEEITRDSDGQVIDDATKASIEKEVRFACAALDLIKFPAHLHHKPRTLETYRSFFAADVLKICVQLEDKWPQLSFCTLHYKALKWIEKHLKSKNERESKAKRSYAESKQDDSRQDHKESNKRVRLTPTPTIPAPTKGKAPIRGLPPRATRSQDNDDDDPMTSDSDEPDTGTPAARGPRTATFSSSVGAAFMFAGSGRATQLSGRGSGPPLSLSADTSTAVPNNASLQTLGAMRDDDVGALQRPVISALQRGMRNKYSGLPMKDLVLQALEILNDREVDGQDPQQPGDAQFLTWLTQLETAIIDTDDEDKSGPSFGHDLVGTWSYHAPLKTTDTYGTIRNACRLLAALLRIWAIARHDCIRIKSTHAPTIQSTIEAICGYIEEAFGPESTVSRASAIQDTNILQATQASTSTASTAARARSAVELKAGVVSVSSLKDIVKILDLGKKRYDPAAKREDLFKVLITAFNDQSIKLTAVQVKSIVAGLPIPDPTTIFNGRAGPQASSSNTKAGW
ncbi:unnamed protein product [Tilletia controversa]|nr:unnamed protein product [Tilletia controversa]